MVPGEEPVAFETESFQLQVGIHQPSAAGLKIGESVFLPDTEELFGKNKTTSPPVSFGAQVGVAYNSNSRTSSTLPPGRFITSGGSLGNRDGDGNGNVRNQEKTLSIFVRSLQLRLFLTWLKLLPFLPKVLLLSSSLTAEERLGGNFSNDVHVLSTT